MATIETKHLGRRFYLATLLCHAAMWEGRDGASDAAWQQAVAKVDLGHVGKR